jgi:RNA polymerase sigma factor (sigma-70 family)
MTLDEQIARCMGYARSLARKRRSSGLRMEDLEAEAYYGVVLALRNYDPARSSLITYATPYIEGALSACVRREQEHARTHISGAHVDPATVSGGQEEHIHAQDVRAEIARRMAVLTPRERQVVSRYYGPREITQARVGDSVHLTRQRIEQILAGALKKMRGVP